MWSLLVSIIASFCVTCYSAESPVYHLALSGNDESIVYWSLDYKKQSVKFEVHVQIKENDWFAIGFSNYGEIYPSDLCVVWTDWKKKVSMSDTWTDNNGIVHEDLIQNCNFFKYYRKRNLLKFTFTRAFGTCDENDYLIEDGTTHIVWARGNGPLFKIDGVNLHSATTSGFQRAQILQTIIPMTSGPSDTWTLEITAKETHVLSSETTYWCNLVKLPEALKRKHHIIQYEPIIQKGHEHVVHHMEVFHCVASADVEMPAYDGPCSSSNRPPATEVCKRVLAAWAMGAQTFSYPEEAGSPIGGPDFNQYVVLEVHYHNSELQAGMVDSSGIRIFVTPTLRKFDAGVMELGLEYTDKMAIPPVQKKFYLHGFCIMECTAVSLPESGIIIFGSQLHTHLTGKRVYTKHTRQGVELQEINRDNHYSQHFQQIRRLKRNFRILPGDALITTCEYNTEERTNITLGGFSITDEMCVNYVHYYPRVDLEVCKSAISENELENYFEFMSRWENQDTSGKKGISEKYKAIQWTPLRVHTLQRLYDLGKLSMQCNQSSGERFPGDWEGVSNSVVQLPMPDERRKCSTEEWSHKSHF